ncbi:MAG: SurA N-terminal domain-containing protein [Candidatus Pelagibacter sp.]
MLGKLRSFSKGKLATVLVAIIIVPFVFWGMGSVFSGGNTNSIAKINNHNLSTKDFIIHLNNSDLTNEMIREKLKDNVLEDELTKLIQNKVIELEIKRLNLSISEEALASIIKKNNIFQNEEGKFSRLKYEKFLLERNLSAAEFELGLKNTELQKQLYDYIAGGVQSPFFKTNKIYNDQYKGIDLEYIKLNSFYKNKNNFTDIEINKYIKDNQENLKRDSIDFTYIKINPNNLVQSNNFDDEFFKKIDLLENDIFNGMNVEAISNKYDLKLTEIKKFIGDKYEEEFFEEIYKRKDQDKIQLIDKNEYFLLYEIKNKMKIIPNNNDFYDLVKNQLYQLSMFNYNKELLTKIKKKEFSTNDFYKLANNDVKIENISLNSFNEKTVFSAESIKHIYTKPNNSFSLINDSKRNIYLAYVKNIKSKKLTKGAGQSNIFTQFADHKVKNNLYISYDNVVNKRYKIEINKKTLERVKNNFN